MQQDVYLGGVKMGGLTSSTEVRILLCYLIATLSPLSREALETGLLGEELVNYFELVDRLEELTRKELVRVEDGAYHITEKGRTVADSLAYDLPRSVREGAARAVIRAQSWLRKEAQHKAEVHRTETGYQVLCRIEEKGEPVFSLTFAMPDSLSAEMVKKQFVARGSEVYSRLLQMLTQPMDEES